MANFHGCASVFTAHCYNFFSHHHWVCSGLASDIDSHHHSHLLCALLQAQEEEGGRLKQLVSPEKKQHFHCATGSLSLQ